MGERWQDKLIGTFLNDYNFHLETVNNGHSHYHEFLNLYDNTKEIISLGLKQQKTTIHKR